MSDSGKGMASSMVVREYPPRLHRTGKSPLQNHSINHYSAVTNLSIVKSELGEDVWEYLRNSSLGVFVKFASLNFTWASRRVEYFLANQLLVDDAKEIWSLIDDQPMRFSINEFAAITGLNCDGEVASDICPISHVDFWREMGLSTATGPTFEELVTIMGKSQLWPFDKRLMLAQLSFLSVAVLCINKGSRIPLELAKRVLDKDGFEKYPWGRVAFDKLISSIKIIQFNENSYALQGPVQVLLVWVYEHVLGIGETYGNRLLKKNEEEPDDVPYLSWASGRKVINFDEFISKEKADHGKVRVKHMEADIFAVSAGDKIDPLLRNLVEDIRSGQLRANAWSEDGKSKKRKVIGDKKDENIGDAETNNKKKKLKGKELVEGPNENAIDIQKLFKMVEHLNSSVEDMKFLMANLAKRVDAIETNVAQQREFCSMFSTMKKYFEEFERKVANDREREDVQSEKQSADESTSEAPSWMVEVNETSNNEFPIARVVKNSNKEKKVDKKEKKAEKKGKKVDKKEKKAEKKENKKKEQSGEKEIEHVLGKQDVTKKVVVKVEKSDGEKKKKDEPTNSEESIWSNPQHKVAEKAMGKALDSLLTLTTKLDVSTPKEKRALKLAGSQKYPFVGNSTVKRIIKGVNVSSVHYDPFEVVDEFLHEKLLEFLKTDEEEPLKTKDKNRRFYLRIITPRIEWLDNEYGWLASGHIAVAMTMFRNRHMRDPSPYHSQRIAFLDAFFVLTMVRDYKDYIADPRNFSFKKNYSKTFNGLQPEVTNKKWFLDIDHLYACLIVCGNHWVALDIDLKKNTIFIYDSIPPKDDTKLLGECRAIRKMIPAILSEFIESTHRKKTCQMMEIRRVLNNVPINEDPGDCGVYALKYIECLALGLTFDGLSDKTIQGCRVRLGSEIFDEVHDQVEDLYDEDCRSKDLDIPHLLDEDEDAIDEL